MCPSPLTGICGVVAFAVSRRTRELGIRMALGATGSDIIGSVLVSGMRPVFADQRTANSWLRAALEDRDFIDSPREKLLHGSKQ